MKTITPNPITGEGNWKAIYRGTEIGTVAAVQSILNHFEEKEKAKPVPAFKMPDCFLTTIVRDGKEVKIQVEIDEYEVKGDPFMELGEKDVQYEYLTEVSIIRAYTATPDVEDVVLTREESERIKREFLEEKEAG